MTSPSCPGSTGIRDFLTNDEGRGVVAILRCAPRRVRCGGGALARQRGTDIQFGAGRGRGPVRGAGRRRRRSLRRSPARGHACDHSRAAGAEARAESALAPGRREPRTLRVRVARSRDRSIFYVGAAVANKDLLARLGCAGRGRHARFGAVGDPDGTRPGLRGSSGSEISTRPDIRWTTSCCGTGSRRLTMRRRKRARRSTSSPTPSGCSNVVRPVRCDQPAGEPADLERRGDVGGGVGGPVLRAPAPELPVPGALVRVPAAADPSLSAEDVYEAARGPGVRGCRRTQRGDLPVIVFRRQHRPCGVPGTVLEPGGCRRGSAVPFTGERDVELESAFVGTRVTPDRAGLKVWPAHGWCSG